MLCLFVFQRLSNGYLASGLTIHEWWNEINAAATYRVASPLLVSEDPPPCPFATAPCGADQDMARRPPSSLKIGRLLQHHQALYPRDLATASAARLCACVRACAWRVWGGEMPDRSKGNGSYCACWLLLGHAARVMPLGRCWPGVGASAAPEPWAIDLLNAPEMEHCVAADRQRCCTEKSFFKSMAKLLAMLLPIVALDVAC